MKTMTSELDELNEVIKGLEEERDEHKSRASDQDDLQAEIDRLQGVLSSNEKALADASKSGEESKAQAKALQGEIKDLLERLRAAEDAKASTQLDAEKAKHANELLQKDLDHAQKQMKTMTSELDELNEVIKGLEEERDEHKSRASDQDDLQAEIDRLQGVLSSNEKALVDASKSGEESKAQAKALQGEIKDLLERLRAAEDAKAS